MLALIIVVCLAAITTVGTNASQTFDLQHRRPYAVLQLSDPPIARQTPFSARRQRNCRRQGRESTTRALAGGWLQRLGARRLATRAMEEWSRQSERREHESDRHLPDLPEGTPD
jgi:hypothetical protein